MEGEADRRIFATFRCERASNRAEDGGRDVSSYGNVRGP
jgi:hypothetical protein